MFPTTHRSIHTSICQSSCEEFVKRPDQDGEKEPEVDPPPIFRGRVLVCSSRGHKSMQDFSDCPSRVASYRNKHCKCGILHSSFVTNPSQPSPSKRRTRTLGQADINSAIIFPAITARTAATTTTTISRCRPVFSCSLPCCLLAQVPSSNGGNELQRQ